MNALVTVLAQALAGVRENPTAPPQAAASTSRITNLVQTDASRTVNALVYVPAQATAGVKEAQAADPLVAANSLQR